MNDQNTVMIERCLGWRRFAERLENSLSGKTCDHEKFSFTEDILKPLGIWDSMKCWLKVNGIGCDCSVLSWVKWVASQGCLSTLGKALGVSEDDLIVN